MMVTKLTQEDKGRHVAIRLKIGAEVRGDIVIVREDFVEIDTGDWVAKPHVNRNSLRRIKYSEIKEINLFEK